MPEGWSGSAWQRQNGMQGLSHGKLSPSTLNTDLVKEEALHVLLYSKGWGMAGRISECFVTQKKEVTYRDEGF